ncbi:M48 family metallopeptidase [Actinokineospora sp. PR83]|uniref:M48 family metallopeptidase n=1 Tax=Actinokineospora sp. PR83 TaxID=2884908 RepID=UPI0027E17133|nr:M48 family metallopeptidase [Actinokineospora sp. PR83]MCG8920603.1 M48 family metallopeptidase [Actinokineospora sp. PR83]
MITWGGGPDGLRARFAERVSAGLYREVVAGAPTRPHRTVAAWSAAAVAGLVHLFTLALAVSAVALVAVRGIGVFQVATAAVLLGLAVLMRPRLGRVPPLAHVLDRESAPTLFAATDQVAEALGGRPVWRIVLTADFNAGYTAVGPLRRPVLLLGHPLWNLLDQGERLALLGHELAHGVNGDTRRGLLVGSSVGSLRELHGAMRVSPDDMGPVLGFLSALVLSVVSLPVLGVLAVQERLLARSGQRAEYYADDLSARLAGTRAVTSLLAKVELGEPAVDALRTALNRGESDIWAAQRAWLAARPAAEVLEGPHRVDATHPPTFLRISALGERPCREPALVLAGDLDAEIRPLLKRLADDLRG